MGKKLNIVFVFLFMVISSLAASENNSHLYQLGDIPAHIAVKKYSQASVSTIGTKGKLPVKTKYLIRAKALSNWALNNNACVWYIARPYTFLLKTGPALYAAGIITCEYGISLLRGPPVASALV